MQNPFSLSFGNTPQSEIKRISQEFDIVEDFCKQKSSSYAYMITGVRGSGKTVYMTDICKTLAKKDEWIIIEVSPEEDIMQNIAYKLSKERFLGTKIVKAGLDLSVLNIEISNGYVGSNAPVSVLLEDMLNVAKKNNKKVLIAIDEAVKNKYIKEFALQFQIYIRKELPIYLIMTGLYENIYEIQNEKTLTFLYRTPRIDLKPLKTYLIREAYEEIFDISPDESLKMAEMTKGYPFAYQVLGYLYYESKVKKLDKIENKYCSYLGEYVYEKIWMEMSEKDKEVTSILTEYENKVSVKELRDALNVSSGNFSHYRDRLKRKGIIDVTDYGYISFSLPYFSEYIKKAYLMY